MGGTAPKEGIIYNYLALYLHGTDGIVRAQSTYATLYAGDSVSVLRFTNGRGWHEERKKLHFLSSERDFDCLYCFLDLVDRSNANDRCRNAFDHDPENSNSSMETLLWLEISSTLIRR